jgi:hypothetical protein
MARVSPREVGTRQSGCGTQPLKQQQFPTRAEAADVTSADNPSEVRRVVVHLVGQRIGLIPRAVLVNVVDAVGMVSG